MSVFPGHDIRAVNFLRNFWRCDNGKAIVRFQSKGVTRNFCAKYRGGYFPLPAVHADLK
jgi:hypothetical protein